MSGLVLSVIWQTLRYRSRDPDVRAAVRWVAVALGGVLVVIVPLVMSVRLGGYGDPRSASPGRRWPCTTSALDRDGFGRIIYTVDQAGDLRYFRYNGNGEQDPTGRWGSKAPTKGTRSAAASSENERVPILGSRGPKMGTRCGYTAIATG